MNNVWLKHYDSGVPETINPDEFRSVPEMLEDCFKKYSNSHCFFNFGESLTYKQLNELSDTFAGFLQSETNLKKGDRVAILMPNTLQYPVAIIGILKAGMVNVNISPLYSSKQIQEALSRSGAKVLLVLENFAYLAEKAIKNTNIETVIVTEIGDLFRPAKRILFNFIVRYIKRMIPSWKILHAFSFKQIMQSTYRAQFKKPDINPEDLAFLQFTEGRSTGTPKCAMLTHRNLIANGLQNSAWLTPFFTKAKNRKAILLILPFSKVGATTCYILAYMRAGYENHIITNIFDLDSIIAEMKDYAFSSIAGVATIFSKLLLKEDFYKINLSKLRMSFSFGMLVPRALAERWRTATHVILNQVYVLTETASIACVNPIDLKEFTGTVGLPLPSTEIKICDESGRDLGFNTIGEIWIKGPQVFKGYWQQPEETQKYLTQDGWFKTSDFGLMTESGFVKLADRCEDIIKTSKGNVYPSEIENVIMDVSGVSEVVVVGGKLSDGHTVIRAFVVRSDRTLVANMILSHCYGHLNQFEVPHEIEFCEVLPKSPVGFVLRRALRERIGLIRSTE